MSYRFLIPDVSPDWRKEPKVAISCVWMSITKIDSEPTKISKILNITDSK